MDGVRYTFSPNDAYHIAAVHDDADVFQTASAPVPAFWAKDRIEGVTPLQVAVLFQSERVLPVLLDAYKSSDRDEDIHEAFIYAIALQRTEASELVLAQCAIRPVDPSIESSPLHMAAMAGEVDVVRRLLEQYAVDVDAFAASEEYDFEATPLLSAILNRHREVVDLLLQNGADPNVGRVQGMSALDVAVSRGDVSLCAALLNHGADPYKQEERRSSAYEQALSRRDAAGEEIVELFEAHADPPED